jgi:hypothetical protein
MSATVEIPGLHVDTDGALDLRRISGITDAFDQYRIIIDYSAAAPYFKPPSMLEVDQEQEYAIVIGQIADRNVLLVAGVVGESQRAVIENSEEACRPAPVLDMRPAFSAGASDEEAGRRGNECFQILGQPIIRGFFVLDAAPVLMRAIACLRIFHRGREGQPRKCTAHLGFSVHNDSSVVDCP